MTPDHICVCTRLHKISTYMILQHEQLANYQNLWIIKRDWKTDCSEKAKIFGLKLPSSLARIGDTHNATATKRPLANWTKFEDH